jgi:hypothetical protein
MPDLDLRAEFAKLCADMPAGDAGEGSYEDTLGLAVHRLVRWTYGHHAGFSTRQVNEVALPALDCPFMMAVAALPFDSSVHRAY